MVLDCLDGTLGIGHLGVRVLALDDMLGIVHPVGVHSMHLGEAAEDVDMQVYTHFHKKGHSGLLGVSQAEIV